MSNKAKIALVLGVVLVVAAALIYYFSSRKEAPVAPDQGPTDSGDIYVPGTTKYPESPVAIESPSGSSTATVSPAADTSGVVSSPSARTPVSTVDENNIRSYTIDVTPAPGAGALDWTRETSQVRVVDASQSTLANKSFCEVSGLKDSWANAIEKISCDTLNFISDRIFDSLAELSCAINSSALQGNYDSTVTSEYENGLCKIIDRGK